MISVIINTKDRLPDLLRCVESLLRQRQPIDELIVVDASRDGAPIEYALRALIEGSGVALTFRHTRAGNAYQRNVGIELVSARSAYVCFFDDDIVLYEDTIAQYLEAFRRHPDAAAVQGIEDNRQPQHPAGRLVRRAFGIGYEGRRWAPLPSGEHVMVLRPPEDQPIGSFMVGLTCIRKPVLDGFRFDEWFQGYAFLEDFEFSSRIGARHPMIIAPAVRLIHNRSTTARPSAFRTSEMYIINKSYCFFKRGDAAPHRVAAYVWSLVGHTVLNLGKSVHRRDPGYVLGTVSGILQAPFKATAR